MMQTFWQDLRYGLRMLVKSPGFTLTAILTLALGIGANTAIFSVVNAVLLRPLPYNEPQRLIALWSPDTRKPEAKGSVSYPDFFDVRAQNTSFERIAVYRTNDLALTGRETPVNIRSAVVSAGLFALLKVNPELGRWFTEEEEKPGGNRAAIISHSLWQKQFGGASNILEQPVTLNGKPYSVVGVMPAGFQFPIEAESPEIWITSGIDAEKTSDDDKAMTEQRGAHFLQTVARLKPGVTLEQAQAEMSTIAANLEKQYPDSNTYRGLKLFSFHEDLVEDYHDALLIILGAVACVLLIACANVANLLLARATVRHKETAIRSALGASRFRLIRQLMTESLLLSVCGGVFGLLLAWWGTEALVGIIPEDLPRLSEINVDFAVLGFTFLISLLTGLGFGLAPAWKSSKTELTEVMKESGRGTSAGKGHLRLRGALIVAEVALALVLLVSAGLLLQTFQKLQRVDLGFDANNVLTASVELPDSRYLKNEQIASFYKNFLERVRALPGVTSAGAVMPQPLSGDTFRTSMDIEGRSYASGENPNTHFRVASIDYFDTMKIALTDGRRFTERDDAKSLPVVIVNETFAKEFFPNENPIGKHVKPGVSVTEDTPWREIVGVVKDVKHRQSLKREFEPELYVPHAQVPFNNLNLVVRTQGDPRALAKTLQAEVNALDKDIPIYRVKTLDQYLGTAIAQPKFNALLIGMFGLLALILTAIGLYGVIAYSVAQRTQEIGIRMALGAQTGDVLRMVLRQGLLLTAIGLALGVTGAYFLTKVLTDLLYGIQPADPLTFIMTSLMLTGVAIVACLVPARRAARTDPMVALRYE
jgi:putative ABC transport system permease protein